MKQYRELINHVLENGKLRTDRTGTGTLSTFGYQVRFNLAEGFPLLPLKKTFERGILGELFWFLDGDTDVSTLMDQNIHIWTPDAYRIYKAKGGTLDLEAFRKHVMNAGFDLGPIYGKQWRAWSNIGRLGRLNGMFEPESIDQIAWVIEEIKRNPDSRRLIVNAWNVADIPFMGLPPCHVMFQFYVEDGKLSCQLYQRSADLFLGVPFNIASYAFLVHMIAHVCELEVGEFIHTFGDLHLYQDHVGLAKLLIEREDKPLPQLKIKRKVTDINDFTYEDFEIEGYDPHPAMKANVSVGQ